MTQQNKEFPPPQLDTVVGEEVNIPSICGQWSFVNGQTGDKVRMWCKSWTCTICKHHTAREVKEKISSLAYNWGLHRILTLTIAPKRVRVVCENDYQRMTYIKQCFNRFRTNWRKNYGKLEYIWTLESHKEGGNPFPHMHLLVNSYMPKKKLQRAWHSSGGGFVDIRSCKDDSVLASYIVKYISKDALVQSKKHAGKSRVWSRSRGLKTPKEMVRFLQESDWVLVKEALENIELCRINATSQEKPGESMQLLS